MKYLNYTPITNEIFEIGHRHKKYLMKRPESSVLFGLLFLYNLWKTLTHCKLTFTYRPMLSCII